MFLFLVCLAVSSVVAIDLGDHQLGSLYNNYQGVYAQTYEDYKPHDYEFGYGVSDPHTGDHKSQWEVKEKGVVRGGYSLLEADGTTRVVEYVADDHGFRAIVKKIDQYGNTHVESHGNPEVHQEHHELATPIVAAEPAVSPVYQTYDGHVDNYVQNIAPVVVSKVAQPIEAYPVVQKEVAYAPAPIQHVEQVQPIEQQYYQAPVLQKEIAYAPAPYPEVPAVQKEIISQTYEAQPVIQKSISYAQAPIVQKELVAPLVQKQINIAPTAIPYSAPQQVYSQEPVYNSYIAKSPYIVDINAFGPKSDAVFVQPKLPVYQQQYEVPQAQSYYGQEQALIKNYGQNVLTPVAKGISQETYPSYVSEGYTSNDFVHPHGESSQGFYASTGNVEDDSAYTNYNQYSQQVNAYPTSYKNFQLPLSSVVGHPVLH